MSGEDVNGAILIVEDADTCRETLEVALSGCAGLDVLTAGSGPEALRILRERASTIRAVVTDLNLPGMGGLEIIREVRGDLRTASVPVIVVSGESDPGASARALGTGADAYFSKPSSPTGVRQKLEQLLNARSHL